MTGPTDTAALRDLIAKAKTSAKHEAAYTIESPHGTIRYEPGFPEKTLYGQLAAALDAALAERDEAQADRRELTKALTSLTCGGSEFFTKRGDDCVADTKRCVEWIKHDREGKRALLMKTIREHNSTIAHLTAENAALRDCLEKIARLSAEPDDKAWRDEYGDPAEYRFVDTDGAIYSTAVDTSNSGDMEYFGYETGLHAAAVIARSALTPTNPSAAATPQIGAPNGP